MSDKKEYRLLDAFLAEKHFQAIMAENRTWLGEDSIEHHHMLDEAEKEYLLNRIKTIDKTY